MASVSICNKENGENIIRCLKRIGMTAAKKAIGGSLAIMQRQKAMAKWRLGYEGVRPSSSG